VSPQPILPKPEKLSTTSGYVAGVFLGYSPGCGIGMINLETKKDYFMPFFSVDAATALTLVYYKPIQHREQVHVMQLPPGHYRIAYWARYDFQYLRINSKTDIPPYSDGSYRFEVLPGKVVVLGRLESVEKTSYPVIEYGIVPRPISKQQFIGQVRRDYPNISIEALDFAALRRDGAGAGLLGIQDP
jgi:hypothetical protein